MKHVLILLSLVAGLGPFQAALGQDATRTVGAGPHYAAGGLRELLLGSDYRDLWTAAIQVPVLDLGGFAGGLTPVERGSGKQTISLRLRAADGRQFNFRSVDKDQTGGLHPDFRETFIDWLAQDQVHSKHPSAGVITHPLLDAVGVLHPRPELYVMPDDARLGEYRELFGGMLGTLEIHPDDGEKGAAGFSGAAAVVGTERLLERLEESPEDRVNSREYLKARLMDLLVGDWDRHVGQWRWARFDRDGVRQWVPIPEDRDNAFSDYDGLLPGLIRGRSPNLVEFGSRYPNLFGLTANAQPLDRPILADLPGAVFDSVALELRGRLTDAVIDAALARAPAEYRRLRSAELASALRARRDLLPEIAARFHRHLAREVEVRATDEEETAEIQRHADGSVEVSLFASGEGGHTSKPYFHRRFVPRDTREVRVYLQGGNDRAVLRGSGPDGPMVRVIGGGGDDVLTDSSRLDTGRARAAFYDDRGENRFVTAGRTIVDERERIVPDEGVGGFNDNMPPHRDWGIEARWFQPHLGWRYNLGPVLGGGPAVTRYGFHRFPFARRLTARALYAPLVDRYGVELSAVTYRTNSWSRMSVQARATQLEVTRFHGYGNDTPGGGSADRFKVWRTEYLLAPRYHAAIGERAEIFFGATARYLRPEVEPGSPADRDRPFGTGSYGEIGGVIGGEIDTRDLPTFPRRGVHLSVSGSAFPGVWDTGSFGGLDGFAATYVPIPFPLETTVAARVGGRLAVGEYPLQHAAFLGGPGSLRGFPLERYAGDGALFGGVELRSFLTRFNFISRGDLGVIALADAGRVFVDGEPSDTWHRGVGAGIWVGVLDRTRTFSLVFSRGEESVVYLSAGMPF